MSAFFADIHSFIYAGGDVLWLILAVALGLWTLIFERLLFFKYQYPEVQTQCLQQWQVRSDKQSGHALLIRQELLSVAQVQMSRGVSLIKLLILVAPLLGLLGTVTGMIHVFDVLAMTGTGNARAMATGVSRATITTMAGMVIAISGLYFSRLIDQRVDEEAHHLADLLKYY